jgi:hypothetical protein
VKPGTPDLPEAEETMLGLKVLPCWQKKITNTSHENNNLRPVNVSPHHPLEQR